jgi:hypothetical protein
MLCLISGNGGNRSPTKPENAMNPKFAGFSKTIIGLVVLIVSIVLQRKGINVLPDDQRALEEGLQIGAEAIGALLVVWGRIKATQPITLLPGKDSTTLKSLLVVLLLGSMVASPAASTGCAQTEENRVAQSVIATKVAADTALHLHAAGVTTPEQERVILGLLRDAARAEDAYYDAIRAGDGAALARAKAAWAVASQRLTAELAKYPVPQTKPIVIPPATQPG